MTETSKATEPKELNFVQNQTVCGTLQQCNGILLKIGFTIDIRGFLQLFSLLQMQSSAFVSFRTLSCV